MKSPLFLERLRRILPRAAFPGHQCRMLADVITSASGSRRRGASRSTRPSYQYHSDRTMSKSADPHAEGRGRRGGGLLNEALSGWP